MPSARLFDLHVDTLITAMAHVDTLITAMALPGPTGSGRTSNIIIFQENSERKAQIAALQLHLQKDWYV